MHLHQSVVVSSPNHSLISLINPTIIILSSSSFPIKNGFCPFIKKKSPHDPIVLKIKSSTHDNNNNNNNNYWWVEEEEDESTQEDDKKKSDSYYMRKCVELANKGIGHTSPDPMMGCVIVKDDVIVGQGFYSKAGETHAEILALREAGKLAEGATAYMNLDPCHDKRVLNNCTSMLLKPNRLVVGTRDPNPIVALKGVEVFRNYNRRGITVGVEQNLCDKLNEAYIHRKLTGKPFLTLRCSVTINGRILDELGEGAKECGGYYSRLLQEYDGVILCSASLKEKTSFPTSKEFGAKQPMQIIITSPPKQVANIVLVKPAPADDHETCGQEEEDDRRIVEQKVLALDTESISAKGAVRKNLRKILDYCAHQGLCRVLFDLHRNSEGLKDLLEEGLELGLFQKVVMEILPFWDSSIRQHSLQELMNKLEKRGLKLNNSPLKITRDSVVVEGYFE